MTIAAEPISVSNPGWLRSRGFDIGLLFGLTAVALSAGVLIAHQPGMLGAVLLLDSWFLGYPHVAATFTRLVPDRAAVKEHRFLVFGLPVIVVAATAVLAFGVGIWAVATVYFYWQWWHTMRQSWGISQLYRRKAGMKVGEPVMVTQTLFYLIPTWGILHRLTTAQDHFIYPGLPIVVPVVPEWLANGAGVLACAGLAYWAVSRVREWWNGELPVMHTLFSASHYLIFITGYIFMDSVAGGWVVTNIWHTAQYLMLVWMFNDNVVKKGAAPKGPFWTLSRGNKAWLYFLICFVGAFPIYFLLNQGGAGLVWGTTGVVLALILNQTLNFHHFIVDMVIWRSKRKPAGTPIAS